MFYDRFLRFYFIFIIDFLGCKKTFFEKITQIYYKYNRSFKYSSTVRSDLLNFLSEQSQSGIINFLNFEFKMKYGMFKKKRNALQNQRTKLIAKKRQMREDSLGSCWKVGSKVNVIKNTTQILNE